MKWSLDESRVRILHHGAERKGRVIYWMSRDQRVHQNWALLFAHKMALDHRTSFAVVFTLVPDFLNASLRQYDFMLKNLKQIVTELQDYNISFYMLTGQPGHEMAKFCRFHKVSHIVTDFDPLRIKRKWKSELIREASDTSVYEVDTHNIVPCWIASQKEEYAAYTIRPKIKKHLKQYLTGFPILEAQKENTFEYLEMDWDGIYKNLSLDPSVYPVDTIHPGELQARKHLDLFVQSKLSDYVHRRNDPTCDIQSGLSPYLHFGHISSQYVASEILKRYGTDENTNAFLEELIVRKELSDNYCYYNSNYDNFQGAQSWARKSLTEHAKDEREFSYSKVEFEKANTHDKLWNAAQNDMVKQGKMHGYLRMYWAKKILEWTSSVEEAYHTAIYLNDKYEFDGRDPNGYTGIAWSIGGIHDRAWTERSVFGKIRYMNYNGCKRKFDVDKYILEVGQI